MKKAYNKPEIMFENFTLNTSIAGDCGCDIGPAKGSCGVEIRGGETVFVTSLGGCSTGPQTVDGTGEAVYNDSICYHTFNGNNVFNS